MAKKAEAHHGGAWKVAYADFVTAMMALFMVLWISAQDQKILVATSQYFRNPFNAPLTKSSGVLSNSNQSKPSAAPDQGHDKDSTKNKQVELTFLNSVAADFYRLLHLDKDLEDKPIDIQVTSDGLRITLFDRAKQPLFAGNTAEFTEWGRFAMQNLSWMIDRHQFRVTIDGHTKARLVLPRKDYGAWELSADRANAARRILVHHAVDNALIERVTGYAATRPFPGEAPEADSNQRITLSLTLTSRARTEKRVAAAAPATPVP
jgi:chemotaxis protein MotB